MSQFNHFNYTDPDDQGIATVVFDFSGEKINKFSSEVAAELKDMIAMLKPKTNIKLLVFKSAKKNIFIAGADIKELREIKSEEDAKSKSQMGQSLFQSWRELPFPTAALIDGACLGGGLEFALACTFRIVTDNKKTVLGLPEVNLGILPGWGGTTFLPHMISYAEAVTMMVTGRPCDGKKAKKINLADVYISSEFKEEELPKVLNLLLSRKSETIKKRTLRQRMTDDNPLFRKLVLKQAHKSVMEKTKGFYPSPLKIIEVLAEMGKHTLEESLVLERKAFAELSQTVESRNLIQLFFAREGAKNCPVKVEDSKLPLLKRSGVMGAGIMGGGIAWLLSGKGLTVRLKDMHDEAFLKGLKSIDKMNQELVKRRKISSGEANVHMNRVSYGKDFKGFSHVDIVVEAIVEDLEIKQTVFAELEQHVPERTILCTNTSSLPIGDIFSRCQRKDRVLGLHFFNPVNKMPLVEIIPADTTEPHVIRAVYDLMVECGKTPVVVKDSPGFLVNRLLLPYMNEALLLVEEGIPVQTIDKVFTDFGMPMGPLTLADEVGLDVCLKVTHILASAFSSRMVVCRLLEKMVGEKKWLGKKNRCGFYQYSEQGKPQGLNADLSSLLEGKSSSSGGDEYILNRCLSVMINEATRCLEENVVPNSSILDLAMIMGTGFPPFRGGLMRYADTWGLNQILKQLHEFKRFGERFHPSGFMTKISQYSGKFYS